MQDAEIDSGTAERSGSTGSTTQQIRAQLHERVKELSFFHHAARLLNMPGETRDIVRAFAELLPSALSFPDLAAARVCIENIEIATDVRSASCSTALRANFELDEQRTGFVEIWYARAVGTAPPFCQEERELLESAAELLKAYLQRMADATTSRALLRTVPVDSEHRAKDEFFGMVAHELRSSLHVMLGWVQMLRLPQVESVTTERGLAILERNVVLQSKLVEDLLDLSRILAGKLGVELRPVDLEKLVAFAVDAKRPAALERHLTLSVALDDVGLVIGDPQRLQQVVYNILGNAVKFTPPGGTIHVSLQKGAGVARLQIEDTGIGISAELLPHVFERFRQADSRVRGRSAGLGLGLPIARDLVALHNGTIEAFSRAPEPGTTFEILLPLGATAR